MSLDRVFEDAVNSKQVPGISALALDKDGKILYRGCFGTTNTNNPHASKISPDTSFLIWSCTKLVTCVAALQLLEQGKLSLDDPVEKHVPEIKEIKILDGFDSDGKPKYRDPKVTMTVRHLMTHTAGFTYDFFDEGTLKHRLALGQTPATILATGGWHEFTTPLLHEPGERYTYGINIDWLGFCIEAISGMRLEEYIKENILHPLGMNDSGSHLRPDQIDKFMVVHMKDQQGNITPNLDIKSPDKPDKFGGGHYLTATIDDYGKFLLTILNNGTHPGSKTQILKEETVSKYIFTDHLHDICSSDGVGIASSALPPATRNGEFLPGIKKTWSCGLLINEEDTKYGRKRGSGMWAGLGNDYYWMDRESGKLGVVFSNVLPFLDESISDCFDALEKSVYGHKLTNETEGKNYKVEPWIA